MISNPAASTPTLLSFLCEFTSSLLGKRCGLCPAFSSSVVGSAPGRVVSLPTPPPPPFLLHFSFSCYLGNPLPPPCSFHPLFLSPSVVNSMALGWERRRTAWWRCSLRRRRRRAAQWVELIKAVVLVLLMLLADAAVLIGAAPSHDIAASLSPTQIVASLVSSVPSGRVRRPLPVYGSAVNSSLPGVYCVDEEHQLLYTGSDVLHVFAIRHGTTVSSPTQYTAGTEAEPPAGDDTDGEQPTYYFEQVDMIYLDGYATACVFANRYEVYIAVACEASAFTIDSGMGDEWPTSPSSTLTSLDSEVTKTLTTREVEGHYYVVVHRYSHRAVRSFAVVSPGAKPTTMPASKFRSGASVVLQSTSSVLPTTQVITPFLDGCLCIENVQSPLTTVQYLTFDDSTIPQSVVQPARGQRRGNTTLYTLTFTPLHLSLSSGSSARRGREGSSDNSSAKTLSPSSGYRWDIQGIILPAVNRDGIAVPKGPVTVSERFARCYAARIAEECPDCLPVTFAASKHGLVVALTSLQTNTTYLALFASGTACTTGVSDVDSSDESSAGSDAAGGTVALSLPPATPSNDHITPLVAEAISPDLRAAPKERRVRPTALHSAAGRGQLEFMMVKIATVACKVVAVLADDAAVFQVYVALEYAAAQLYSYGEAKRFLLRVEVAVPTTTMNDELPVKIVQTPVRQPNPLTANDVDDETDEMLSLSLDRELRLLYLTVRRADGTVRVFTYAAYGLSAITPRAVDAMGGSVVRLTGFGLHHSVQCVFVGSDDEVVVPTHVDTTSLLCSVPPLTGDAKTAHPIALRRTYTQPWAIPASKPHYAVVSPTVVSLVYLASPQLLRAVNAETGLSWGFNGTNVTVLVIGKNFMDGRLYDVQSLCHYSTYPSWGFQNMSAPALFVDSSTMQCTFVGMQMIGNPAFISVSIDGVVNSSRRSIFSVHGPPVGLKVFGTSLDVEHAIAGVSEVQTSELSADLRLRSATHVTLPNFTVSFVDIFMNIVQPPATTTPLYAALLQNSNAQDIGSPSDGTFVAAVDDINAEGRPTLISGVLLQPFSADGEARFSNITLECPPLGVLTFSVAVSDGKQILYAYAAERVRVTISEGDPYALVFVGWPSTWYYPDVPLLQQQPVVGVRDACGNVFTYLNDSVLVGPLTVQLFAETVAEHTAGDEVAVRSTLPYGAPWTVPTPLNNLFYIHNISLPALNFRTRFFIQVTAALPQPTIESPRIAVVPCQANRQSRIVPADDAGDGATRIVCAPCPAHGICNGTSAVRAEDGYWRLNSSTTVFTSCRVASGVAEACVNDSQCAPGYRGVLCGECADGYHTFGRACRKCLRRGIQGFLTFLVLLAMVVIMTVFTVFMTLIPPSTLAVLSIRSLLLAVQVASLFIFIGVPWPGQLETFFNGLFAMAEMLETMVTCFFAPQGFLIFMACSPLVLIPLITLFAGVFVRVVKLHRVDPYRLSAVVLMALLHRKQERFHQLRHTIAREMGEQRDEVGWGADGRRNDFSEQAREDAASRERGGGSLGSYLGVSASATRLSMSAGWAAQERNASAVSSSSYRQQNPSSLSGRRAVRTTQPSFSFTAAANSLSSAAHTDSTPAAATTAGAASAAALAEGKTPPSIESVIVDAFAVATAAVMDRLAAAAGPETTWEQLVVQAMRDGNPELLAAVREMRLSVPTRRQVQKWAEFTTEMDVDDVSNAHASGGAAAPRTEGSANSLSKSSGVAAEARHPIHRSAHKSTGDSSLHAFTPSDTEVGVKRGAVSKARLMQTPKAAAIRWKRVGMIAAYREMAVYQFRASWAALLCSAGSVVMVCYYLPLILDAFLWMQCVTVKVWPGTDADAISVPRVGASMSCTSSEYFSMRKLAIAMLVVYGFAWPVQHVVAALFLQRRYGNDVMYAALPVVFFGDSSLDYLIAISYILTKLVAVIAATQTDSPMLQMSVLGALFAFTIFLNSMWNVSGQSVVLSMRYLTITLRSIMTASRVLFLLVCEILLLLAYLIVSGYNLSPSGERGFVAIVSLGISVVFAVFTAVCLHQFATFIRDMRHSSNVAAKRKREEQLLLQALVRRYLSICQIIELYLKVCERGLCAAQKLDMLARYTRLPDDDTIPAASESVLSFSSLSDADRDSVDSSLDGERWQRMRRSGSRRREGAASASAAGAATTSTEDTGPEELTHFSPYPALPPTDYLASSPSPPTSNAATTTEVKESARMPGHHRTGLRRTTAYLSTAFRASDKPSGGGDATSNSTGPSTLQPQRDEHSSHPTSLLLRVHTAGYTDGAGFVSPVEGNEYWVNAPRRSSMAVVANVVVDAGHNKAQPDGDGGGAVLATVTVPPPAAAAASAAVVPVPATPTAVKDSSRGVTPILPESGAPGPEAAPTASAGDETRAEDGDRESGADNAQAFATLPLQRVSPDTFSGDFTDVQPPTAQPQLERGDSLLLSIRSFNPDNATKVQKIRDALVEASAAVAMAEYVQERRRQLLASNPSPQRSANHAVAQRGKTGEVVDAAAPNTKAPAGLVTLSSVELGQQPQPQQLLHTTSPAAEIAVTIENMTPIGELDFVSTFDPLAVPPLPLTHALSRLRSTNSSAPLAGFSTTHTVTKAGSNVKDLLADLQTIQEAHIRDLNAVSLRDFLLDVDLGQLTSVPSMLQQNLHPVSLWGGTRALESVNSAAPLSSVDRLQANQAATGRGGATQMSGATLANSKSVPRDSVDGTTFDHRSRPDHSAKSGLESFTKGTASTLTPARRRGEFVSCVGTGSSDRGDDAPASGSDDASVAAAATALPFNALPPQLPQFRVPAVFMHGLHRTAAEHLRRRAARTSRAHRSRSGGQNGSRNRTKHTVAGTPRATLDSKSFNSADVKPKSQ
jgi:hypothetical protein